MTNRQEGDAEHGGGSPDRTGDGAEPAPDEELPAPAPGRSVEAAIKVQLAALGDNDEPYTNAGIKTVFNFATPAFRRDVGGSLEAFVDHFTGPIHQALLDHREARRGRLRVDEGVAREKVVVTDEDGDEATYEFTLVAVEEGKYEGCWMTDDVELVYVGASPDHVHMPNVDFDGVEIKCKEGEVLRNVLLRASGVSPHNQAAQYANCNGRGLCGTCAVEVVDGEVTEPTAQERRRMRLPPHDDKDNEGYRLSCQARVLSDLVVHKHEGMWGQHVEEYSRDSEEEAGEPIRVTDEEYQGLEEPAGAGGGRERSADREREDLDLSDEAVSLLDEAESMLDEDEVDEDEVDEDEVDEDELPDGND